ncbi:MAG: hypothetical protein AB7L09_00560 [Nitrospira sp.]
MIEPMNNAAIELAEWLRFAGCEHIGFISVAVSQDALLVYWDKMRMAPGGMPATFAGYPVKLKRIGRPIPATS